MKNKVLYMGLSVLMFTGLSANEVPIQKSVEVKDVFINVDSKLGNELLKSEILYKSYLEKEVVQNGKINLNRKLADSNKCEINKLKKALVKMIKGSGYLDNSKVEDSVKELPKLEILSEKTLSNEDIIKNCKTKKCKIVRTVDTSNISSSYYAFEKSKKFKVTYNIAGTFNLPILGISRNNLLHKGDNIVADMYTKAGWVHIVGGDWVKGYKLYPRVLNNITVSDTKKWKQKFVEKTVCK